MSSTFDESFRAAGHTGISIMCGINLNVYSL